MRTIYRYASTTGGRHVHRIVAEKAYGRRLPCNVPVHHVNGDGFDPSPGNLVICQDTAYHKLLHIRQRALDACGNANWRKCTRCKRYDDPANLSIISRNSAGEAYHRACANAEVKARYRIDRERILARDRLRRPAERERRRTYSRSYYARNKAKWSVYKNRRAAVIAELQKVENLGR